jgi:thiol-disulfide isomerase/thioredoxin
MDSINSILEFNELKANNQMMLAYFSSNSCIVCKDLIPKLELILEKYPNVAAVRVEAENSPELSASYHVFSAPVIILFIQGKETVREAGIISLSDFEQKLTRYCDILLAPAEGLADQL